MKTYTVVAVYADNHQRYADTFEAKNPEGAEKKAQALAKKEEASELIIAAVFEGDVKPVA